MRKTWSALAVGLSAFVSVSAGAQIKKVVATGDDGGKVGTITNPVAPAIADDGSISFNGNAAAKCVILVARPTGSFECAAKLNQGILNGGTLVGVDFALYPTVPITGPWLVFTATTSDGDALLGYLNGALSLLGGPGTAKPGNGVLGPITGHRITNTNGESLLFEQSGHLWRVASTGALTSVFAVDEAVPGLAGYTGKVVSQFPQLDDNGEVSVVVSASNGSTSRAVVLHGPPGQLAMDEPLGLTDEWAAKEVYSNADGVMAYVVQVAPSGADPWKGIWAGSAGATTQAVKFPTYADGLPIKEIAESPLVVGKGGRFVFKGYVEVPSDPLVTRMAVVLVDPVTKAQTLIAAEGDPVPWNNAVDVHQIDNYAIGDNGDVYVGLKYADPVTAANPGQGVFVRTSSGAKKILATGDVVDLGGLHGSKPVDLVGIAQSHGAGYARAVNAGGQLAMEIAFDGAQLNSAIVTQGAPPTGAVDLAVSIKAPTALSGTVSPTVSIDITVENVGKVEASAVHLEIGTTHQWSSFGPQEESSFKCTPLAGTFFSCGGTALAPGEKVVLTASPFMAVTPEGQATITAKVLAPGQDDSNTVNNQASHTMTVTTAPVTASEGGSDCGCEAPGRGREPAAPALLLLALSALAVRRSRRPPDRAESVQWDRSGNTKPEVSIHHRAPPASPA